MKAWVVSVGFLLVGTVTGLLLASIPVSAHDIDKGYVTVAATAVNCLELRSEIDHDANDQVRISSRLNHYAGGGGGSGCSDLSRASTRMKASLYREVQAGGALAVCTSTLGDGLGDAGYLHVQGDGASGLNTSWQPGWPCGDGGAAYVSVTDGHVQNNGWIGGRDWSLHDGS